MISNGLSYSFPQVSHRPIVNSSLSVSELLCFWNVRSYPGSLIIRIEDRCNSPSVPRYLSTRFAQPLCQEQFGFILTGKQFTLIRSCISWLFVPLGTNQKLHKRVFLNNSETCHFGYEASALFSFLGQKAGDCIRIFSDLRPVLRQGLGDLGAKKNRRFFSDSLWLNNVRRNRRAYAFPFA